MNDCHRCLVRSISSTASLVATLLVPVVVRAQPQPPAPSPPLTTPPAAMPPSTTPATPGAVETPVAAASPTPAPPAAKWYEKVKVEGFVDTYASLNYNLPKPQSGQNIGRAFDTSNGFALHWVGLNASYAPDPVGATVGLRFGPGAYLYNTSYDVGIGAGFVKQAFVSWKPGGGMVTIDFGKFDTCHGSEVADSQYNMNYTRSFLYSTQPLFHTGLRVDFALNDMFDLKLFAINGWNDTADNNAGKSFAASIGIIPAKIFTATVNWMGGPEQADMQANPANPTGSQIPVTDANSRWRHLVDLVLDLHPDKFHALLNADLGAEPMPSAVPGQDSKGTTWYGANLTLGYAFSDLFSAAVRGGYFKDQDGWAISKIVGVPAALGHSSNWGDATLTLALTPTPNLIIKLDQRIDSASIDGVGGIFPKDPGSAPAKTMVTTTLGLVATTN